MSFGIKNERLISDADFSAYPSPLTGYQGFFGNHSGLVSRVGGIFGGISGAPSYLNISLARNEQSQSGKNQKHREDSQPLSILGYSFVSGRFGRAWREATPGRLFLSVVLFAIGWFAFCFSAAVFFGGK